MNNQPFTTAAETWIYQLTQKRKLTKGEKRAVIAFGMWLDHLTEEKEKRQNEEN